MKEDSRLNELILLAINYVGRVYGRTYMQKLFFLIENELFRDMDLNYIKYHYGPFSRDLAKHVEELKTKGFMKEIINISNGHEGHCYELTKKGQLQIQKIINKSDSKRLQEFCDKFKQYTPSELLRYVYSKYPEWTTNSVLNNSEF
jgi:uncharacterized protein YwgA